MKMPRRDTIMASPRLDGAGAFAIGTSDFSTTATGRFLEMIHPVDSKPELVFEMAA
jgi:hypothetical protein